jgi:glycosyltransferase involved in cell wall biosynthesis
MAVGRPVIASSVGGLVDIVDDGATGLLTPPGDEAALAAAMSRLIRSPELRAEFGRAGAIRSAGFSARVIVPRIEAVYRRLCDGRESTVDSRSAAELTAVPRKSRPTARLRRSTSWAQRP